MKKRIVVVDGLGGGIGAQLVTKLREAFGESVEIIALGTNAGATERMMRAGADRGASGENAIRVSVRLGDFVLGPIGIVIPDGMLGEITSGMAQAILAAPGARVLIPVQQEHFSIVGLEAKPLGKLMEEAMLLIAEKLEPNTRR